MSISKRTNTSNFTDIGSSDKGELFRSSSVHRDSANLQTKKKQWTTTAPEFGLQCRLQLYFPMILRKPYQVLDVANSSTHTSLSSFT
jgi:hypothetical protein